jgi:hypothetical protein
LVEDRHLLQDSTILKAMVVNSNNNINTDMVMVMDKVEEEVSKDRTTITDVVRRSDEAGRTLCG